LDISAPPQLFNSSTPTLTLTHIHIATYTTLFFGSPLILIITLQNLKGYVTALENDRSYPIKKTSKLKELTVHANKPF
jgi:hypothetical protein